MRCSGKRKGAVVVENQAGHGHVDRIRSLQNRHAVDRPTPVEFPRTTTNFYCFTN